MIPAQPMEPWGGGEVFFFILANLIIFYFCAPRVLVDVRRWFAKK